MLRTSSAADEIVRRGQEIYDREIRQKVEPEHNGKYVVIDISSGDYVVGTDCHALSRQMLASKPDAVLCVLKIGYPTAGRVGGRFQASDQRSRAW
jgi:hypothetical protein